jgi:NAD(P)-dependent dehydrogenase (short-subunit alcohol dehydrogenase family)
MDASEFDGQVALITGGGRGIGRACCLRLAAGGATIALNYRSDDAAARETQRLVEERGGSCNLFKADVGDEPAFRAALDKVRARLGQIGLLIANAGTTKAMSHEDLTVEIWRETLRVNLDGPFVAIRAVKDEMLARGSGSIVCVSSIAALRPRARQIDYAAAKAGVIALTRCFADALAPSVRVNCVAPGLTETDMLGQLDADKLPGRIAAIPLQRIGRPEEVAETIAFLLSERASYLTGQCITVSGGDVMM